MTFRGPVLALAILRAIASATAEAAVNHGYFENLENYRPQLYPYPTTFNGRYTLDQNPAIRTVFLFTTVTHTVLHQDFITQVQQLPPVYITRTIHEDFNDQEQATKYRTRTVTLRQNEVDFNEEVEPVTVTKTKTRTTTLWHDEGENEVESVTVTKFRTKTKTVVEDGEHHEIPVRLVTETQFDTALRAHTTTELVTVTEIGAVETVRQTIQAGSGTQNDQA